MKSWDEVVKDPEFMALSPQDKRAARQQYFDEVVKPRVREDEVEMARAQFFSDYPVRSMPDPVDPTEGMSGLQRGLAGAGKALVDVGRGVGERLGLVSPEQIAESNRLDQPLMNTTGGAIGNVAGKVISAAPTMMVPGANTVLGSGAIAALYGAAEPTQDAAYGSGVISNILTGALAGGGITAAARAVPALYGGLVSPMTSQGRDKIVMDTIGKFSRNPESVFNAKPEVLVPGSMPTLAEATGDVGIAQLQRTLASASPKSAGAQWEADVARNKARLDVIRSIAKTPEDLDAAEKLRRQVTAPLYKSVAESEASAKIMPTVRLIDGIVAANPKREAIVKPLSSIKESLFDVYPETKKGEDAYKVLKDTLNTWKSSKNTLKQALQWSAGDFQALQSAEQLSKRVREGVITSGQAIEQIKSLRPKGKEPKLALDIAEGLLNKPNKIPTTDIYALQSASKNIGDLIAKKGPNGLPENEAIVRELSVIKKSLDNQIAKAEPAYKTAQKTFQEMSKPIDQMKVGQTILDKATSALAKRDGDPSIYGEQFARALRADDKTVRAATGFKRNKGMESVFSSDQMKQIKSVEKDIARFVQSQEAGKVPGSPTAQYLAGQNLIDNIIDPLGIPKPLQSLFQKSIVDDISKRFVGWVGSKSGLEEKIQERMTDLLLNPDKAAKVARDYQAAQTGTSATLKRQIGKTLPIVSIGVSANTAEQ